MSEYRQVVDMRKSSVTSRSTLPSGASSCHFILRFDRAAFTQILTEQAVFGAQQVTQHVFMPFTGAQQVGTPDKHIARIVLRIIRVFTGKLQATVFQFLNANPSDPSLPRQPL